jgi:hypothetical protein
MTIIGPTDYTVLATDQFAAGQRVHHSIFGNGVVEGLRGPKDGRSIVILFDHQGRKELVLSFCGDRLQHEPSCKTRRFIADLDEDDD